MKISMLLLFLSVFSLESFCQKEDLSKRPSPPATAMGKIGTANVTVKYSAPSVKGRSIWGGLVPYGEVWRSGANEATTFTTDKDIKVEGQLLKASTYSFFTIPGAEEWTIIFNKVANQWGAFKYEQKEDALRVKTKAVKSGTFNEKLKYEFIKDKLMIYWDKLMVPVTISN